MVFSLRKDREELKYIYLESVLQSINAECVALNEEEKRRNNVILDEVLKQIITKMKEKSKLFKSMFRKEFYGGSYYDNLKVGKPDEYDLDLLLHLPKYTEPVVEPSDLPGFVQIRLENFTSFLKQLYSDEFPNLANKLLDEQHYLSTSKASSWIESVLTLAVNEFPSLSVNYPHVKQIKTRHGTFYFAVYKSGPAFTLKLKGTVDKNPVKIDIDLVPCFVFPSHKWPRRPYRQNPVPERSEFFVVPKKPTTGGFRNISSYWRLSFQEQEGDLINGLQNLKPALRLLKTLRDACRLDTIASYYLKTIFLYKVEENNMVWQRPLSYVFMEMLKKWREHLERGEIPYFWNSEYNLINRVNSYPIGNRLRNIINDIERYPNDPTRIKQHFMRYIPESAVYDFWSDIKDLPENKPQDSWCTIS